MGNDSETTSLQAPTELQVRAAKCFLGQLVDRGLLRGGEHRRKGDGFEIYLFIIFFWGGVRKAFIGGESIGNGRLKEQARQCHKYLPL